MASAHKPLPLRTRPTRAPALTAHSSSSRSVTAPLARSDGSNTELAQAVLRTTNISLFLTNLRLLDLDQLPDWPDINALTFTNKDASQGQKKRIQSVEWALYQLFVLWNPEEARNVCSPAPCVSALLLLPCANRKAVILEAGSVLPSPRPTAIHELARRSATMFRSGQEGWSLQS